MQVDITNTTTSTSATPMRSHVHIAAEPSPPHSQHKKNTPPMIHSQDDDSDSSTDDASEDESIFRATQSTGLLHRPSSRQSPTQLVQHSHPTQLSLPQKVQKPALLDLDSLEDDIRFSMSAAAPSTEAATPQTQTTDRAHRSGGKRAIQPLQALLLDNTESVAAPTPCSSTSSDVEEVGLWGLPSPVWKKARVQGESTIPNRVPPSSTKKDSLPSVQSPGSEPSRESPSPPPQDDLAQTPQPKQQEQRQSTGLQQANGHGHKYEHKHEPKKDQTPVNIHIELLNDKDDNDGNDNDAQEDSCCQEVDEDDHLEGSANQTVNHVSSARLGLGQAQGAHASANRSNLLTSMPTITTHGLTRTLSHMNPHPHHSHPHTHTHTRNYSSPSLLDSFTSPEPMLSPIQSYFGSDPNSIASAFSLPRHDHYPRPSDDPQSTAGPADGYHGYATYPWSEQSTTPSRALSHRWTRRLSHPDSIPSTPSRLRLTSAAPTVPIASAALSRTWQETLQSTSHSLDLSTSEPQATFNSGQDLLQDDQDLEDGDNAMGESYDCQESILQSEDDTELLDDEDDEDDESYPYGYSGTELDDELYEPCGPEEDGDSDMDDQGSESLLLEEEDTSVSYNPRIADFDSSSTAGRHVADTFIEDDDVGNALAHVLGLGRLEDDRLAGTLHHASSDSPRQSIAPISDEFSALVGTAVS